MDYSKEELKIRFDMVQKNKVKGFLKNTFRTENNIKYILEIFVEKLLEDNVIKCIDDLPKVINTKLFLKYKIYHVMEYFNNSPINTILFLYPDRWNVWNFNISVPYGTWDDKNNIIGAVRDIVINKVNIKSYEDIFLVTSKVFEKYRLSTILNIYNYDIPKILQDSFPEYYLPAWRFKHVHVGYWEVQENRVIALKEFIEDYLKLSIENIPKVITPNYLKIKYPKLLNVYNAYYYGNLFSWINEVYPNKFKPEDFIENIGADGKKLASREEVLVHNLLLDNFNNVIYYENTNDKSAKLYDSENNDNYIPDWILEDKIIVEYFGLYAPNRTTKFSTKYNKRTKKKINFYTRYCKENPQYFFISLFPCDLENNLQGVKNKLNIA